MVKKWWKSGGKMVKKWWKNGEKVMEKGWKNGEKVVEKPLTHLEPAGVARIGPGAGNGLPERHRDGE